MKLERGTVKSEHARNVNLLHELTAAFLAH